VGAAVIAAGSPRRTALAASLALAAACLLLAGLGASGALAASGGVSVTPGILEATARPGAVGALEIANTTSRPMKVSLAVRPWRQARSGSVAPNRRKLLGKLRPNRKSFWLHAGATKSLGLTLAARPGRLFEHGSARHGGLFLAVKNAGNTIVPIGGTVVISGHHHTLSGIVAPKAIVPGATVNLRLARLRGTLPRGRYKVSARLTQGGHRAGGTTRRRGVLH
jgi:hypothetical protein